MVTSEKGIDLIKSHEGLKLVSYLDSVKIWTIGYGHTGKDVIANQTISINQATNLLRLDLKIAENAINHLVTVKLKQNQFDALVSFVYNIGVSAFRNSTLLKLLNAGKYEESSKQFNRWDKADGKVLPGLSRRREQERILFNA